MLKFLQWLVWMYRLWNYLSPRTKVRAQLAFEIDSRPSRVWLSYDHWPLDWKARLAEFCAAYDHALPLPMSDSLPLADLQAVGGNGFRLAYRDNALARDVYLAQVAHVLWLEIARNLPWRLDDWSDDELSYLLSSKVCFRARRNRSTDALFYEVHKSSTTDETESILTDPRVAYRFLQREPEQGRRLLGTTPSETAQRVSEWFHDYLWHTPEHFDLKHVFYRKYPLLSDKLRRYHINPYGNVYIARGCGGASSLFTDLLRAANIPVLKVHNVIEGDDRHEQVHSGLVFNWQGSSSASRYLLHTDDLYAVSAFQDPAPAPKNAERGIALWSHVWLDPNSFGTVFGYDPRESVFGKASSRQFMKHRTLGSWLVASSSAVAEARRLGEAKTIDWLKQRYQLSQKEAEDCWQTVEASVRSYGDGDMTLGYERLLDGPQSRHQQWCSRTGKCPS